METPTLSCRIIVILIGRFGFTLSEAKAELQYLLSLIQKRTGSSHYDVHLLEGALKSLSDHYLKSPNALIQARRRPGMLANW